MCFVSRADGACEHHFLSRHLAYLAYPYLAYPSEDCGVTDSVWFMSGPGGESGIPFKGTWNFGSCQVAMVASGIGRLSTTISSAGDWPLQRQRRVKKRATRLVKPN